MEREVSPRLKETSGEWVLGPPALLLRNCDPARVTRLPHLQNGNSICPVPCSPCGEGQRSHTGQCFVTGKAFAAAGSLVTVAAGMPACMLTPLLGQGAFLPEATILFFNFFLATPSSIGILIPQPGVKPMPIAVGAWIHNPEP